MRIRALHVSLLTLTVLSVAGCQNACQALCTEMYDYALECGIKVKEAELEACIEENSNEVTPRSSRDSCKEHYENVRDEWDCDDLARYWDEEEGETEPQDTGTAD